MKRILTVCAVILLYAESGYTQSSDRVEGIWFSIDEKTGEVTGNWDLYVLGSALYGKPIVGHPQQKNAKAVKCRNTYRGFPVEGKVNEMFIYGTPWIFGLRREEPGRWKGGNIINPLNELSISTVLRFMRLTESGSKLIRLKCGMRSDWEWAEASSGLRVLSKNNNSGLNKMPNEIKYTACCFLLALSPFVFIVQN